MSWMEIYPRESEVSFNRSMILAHGRDMIQNKAELIVQCLPVIN